MKIDRFTEDFVKTAKDGFYRDSDELQLYVRRNGRTKLWCTSYCGTPFGERKNVRLSLGSADKLSIKEAKRLHLNTLALVDQGKSPGQQRKEKLYQDARVAGERAEVVTLGQAIAEFFKEAVDTGRWRKPRTILLNTGIKKNYLDGHKLMDMLARDVRSHHIETLVGPYWKPKSLSGKPGIGKRARSLLHSTFEREIDLERYGHRNPASWRKQSPLSRRLGPPVRSTPRPDVRYEDVPLIVRHLHNPPQVQRLLGYLTTTEAAYATDRSVPSIRAAKKRGLFPGLRQLPGYLRNSSHTGYWSTRGNLIPVDELVKTFPLVRDPVIFEREDPRLYARVLLFVILTGCRSDMACQLRWDQIKKHPKYGETIEYKGASTTTESEHKTGHGGESYIVIVTPGVRAILDAERERQRVHKIDSEFVFVHGRTHAGLDRYYGQTANKNTLNLHLKNAAKRIPEVQKKDVTVHGLRTAFGSWATEEKGLSFDSDVVNLTLGHIIAAIRDNKANSSYLRHAKFLNARRALMMEWEAHCLSLVSEPLQAAASGANVISLSASA
jgi:integrase